MGSTSVHFFTFRSIRYLTTNPLIQIDTYIESDRKIYKQKNVSVKVFRFLRCTELPYTTISCSSLGRIFHHSTGLLSDHLRLVQSQALTLAVRHQPQQWQKWPSVYMQCKFNKLLHMPWDHVVEWCEVIHY